MSDATQTQRPRVTVQQFNALVTEVREIHRKLDLVLDKLNIPLTPVAPGKGTDGVRHLPGSQPFGTTTPEDPESDPIPGAGPSTARQALNGGLDGSAAAVIPIDHNSRNNHPTHRKDQS
uniref:Uncharacterized protein n=1 Tax=uncultured bacterium A1Q1_fos_2101 TaxID=1256561 RepID=L7VZ10_9BACT|nr:hypothetical protein [uncultured bacterium A1Q1_fos_2101]